MNAEKFGLKDTIIISLQEIFKKFEAIEKVIVYGSRAKGNFRHNSDIDLSIFGKISYDDLLKIEILIDDLLLPYKIDLSCFEMIENQDLRAHIERVGKIFYENHPTTTK